MSRVMTSTLLDTMKNCLSNTKTFYRFLSCINLFAFGYNFRRKQMTRIWFDVGHTYSEKTCGRTIPSTLLLCLKFRASVEA